MATPSTLSYGTVVGQFLVSASDGADADTLPDAVPASGTVTFAPSAGVVLDYSQTPNPAAILKKPIVCTLDSEGYLTGPDGTRGVKLLATDNPTVKPVGWTWVATYALRDDAGNILRTLTTQAFYVPSGATTDLIVSMPIEESKGVFLSKGDKGDLTTLSIGTVTVGTPAVSVSEVGPESELSFVLPVNNLQIGTVEVGDGPDAPAPDVMVDRGVFYAGDVINFESGTIPAGWTYDRLPTVVTSADAVGGTTKALQLADINDGQSTYVEFPVDTDGDIIIRYENQTEQTYDVFSFALDGTTVITSSGTSTFRASTIPATDGLHTVRLTYTKDSSQSTGYDNVRISSVLITKTPAEPYKKGNVVSYNGNYYIALAESTVQVPGTGTDWKALSAPPTVITADAVDKNFINSGAVFNTPCFKDINKRLVGQGTFGTIAGADIVGPAVIGVVPLDMKPKTYSLIKAVRFPGNGVVEEISLIVYGDFASPSNHSNRIVVPAGVTLPASTNYNLFVNYITAT